MCPFRYPFRCLEPQGAIFLTTSSLAYGSKVSIKQVLIQSQPNFSQVVSCYVERYQDIFQVCTNLRSLSDHQKHGKQLTELLFEVQWNLPYLRNKSLCILLLSP